MKTKTLASFAEEFFLQTDFNILLRLSRGDKYLIELIEETGYTRSTVNTILERLLNSNQTTRYKNEAGMYLYSSLIKLDINTEQYGILDYLMTEHKRIMTPNACRIICILLDEGKYDIHNLVERGWKPSALYKNSNKLKENNIIVDQGDYFILSPEIRKKAMGQGRVHNSKESMNRKNIKCLHWNINQRFPSNTPVMIIAEIMRQDADIIILTEFYKTENYDEILVTPLKQCGYRIFLDPRNRKDKIRQVMIAVRSKLIMNQEVTPLYLHDNEGNIENGKCPNYLRIDIKIDYMPISIIGTRIRVWESSGIEEQKRRKNQFKTLLKELSKLPDESNLIIMGDFNISDDDAYKKSGSKWHFDNDYKSALERKNLKLYIPKKGFSPFKSNYKLDHLIVSKDIDVEDYTYFCNDSWPDKGKNNPDHSIFLSNLLI